MRVLKYNIFFLEEPKLVVSHIIKLADDATHKKSSNHRFEIPKTWIWILDLLPRVTKLWYVTWKSFWKTIPMKSEYSRLKMRKGPYYRNDSTLSARWTHTSQRRRMAPTIIVIHHSIMIWYNSMFWTSNVVVGTVVKRFSGERQQYIIILH